MHYLQLIITKAEDQEDAEDQVTDFMNKQCGDNGIVDWYEIGGRWFDVFNKTTVTLKQAEKEIARMFKDRKKEIKELKIELINKLSYGDKKDDSYLGYQLRKLGNLMCDSYYGDVIIYNLDDYSSWNLPDDNKEEYFVTVVDIHN